MIFTEKLYGTSKIVDIVDIVDNWDNWDIWDKWEKTTFSGMRDMEVHRAGGAIQ